ncbi:MAG: DUF427 domain-containing protein [Actinomycetota bacterium]|nr:DUF427 domain-containing protein [Actinomycetota bacterium]
MKMPEVLKNEYMDAAGPQAGSHVVRLEISPRKVRAVLNGVTVADSRRVALLLETGHLPVYYFPKADVRMDLLQRTEHSSHCPFKGDATYWSIEVPGKIAVSAVWGYENPISEASELSDYVAFYWNKIDSWFEEDDEVFVHARDPYSRVDVLHSSRHVRVVLSRETVADTTRPRLLFETGLPTRYYIPRADVRMELLRRTDSSTRCPYKGIASYFSAEVRDESHEDIAWTYDAPIPECPKIESLICFFNEKVDELWVDDELQEWPETHWA